METCKALGIDPDTITVSHNWKGMKGWDALMKQGKVKGFEIMKERKLTRD